MPNVDLLVTNELLPELPHALTLLKATDTGRRTSTQPGMTSVTIDMPSAPADAIGVEPTFERRSDGTVVVQSVRWITA